MLRQIWLSVALIIFSLHLYAQTNNYTSQPKTGRVVKYLASQIAYREPLSTKKIDYDVFHQVVHEAGPNIYHRFKVYPEPLRLRKMRIFEGGIPRMRQP